VSQFVHESDDQSPALNQLIRDLKRPDEDPMVIEALSDGRHAEDIYLVQCPWCDGFSYYNQGSHASCRICDRDLTPQIADTITLADYWYDTPYPTDETQSANAVNSQATNENEKSADT
jgi:hypothetical protein